MSVWNNFSLTEKEVYPITVTFDDHLSVPLVVEYLTDGTWALSDASRRLEKMYGVVGTEQDDQKTAVTATGDPKGSDRERIKILEAQMNDVLEFVEALEQDDES